MKCRGCGAPVIWVRMQDSGKRMPVDEDPVLVLQGHGSDTFVRADGEIVHGIRIGDGYDDYPDDNVIEAYVSHFATCPQANQYRRREKP